jgi:hypothetical protein
MHKEIVMRQVRVWLAGLAALALVGLIVPAVHAEKKQVKLTNEWTGSVEDEKLLKDAPACVTSKKGLENLWKAWKISDKMPEVDFDKEIVVISTTRGSKLKAAANLDEKGNLQVLGVATQDLRPGFRYVIATVSKEGVKTVNGKELPKE